MENLHDLPAVFTTFAYGESYLRAAERMLATVRQHHGGWPTVIGRALPAPGEPLVLEVEAEGSRERWSVPVALALDGVGDDDWRKITRLKGWWLAEVWRWCVRSGRPGPIRIVWLDVDAWLHQPLDVRVDPGAEVVAGPWWIDPDGLGRDTITSGFLLLQGAPAGATARILDLWCRRCLEEIESLPPYGLPWRDGDQEVLNALLAKLHRQPSRDFETIRLDHDRYCWAIERSAPRQWTTADPPVILHGVVDS